MAIPLREANTPFPPTEAESHEADFRQFFERSPLGLGSVDRRGRFFRVNQNLAALHGVEAERHVGRTLSEIHPGAARQLGHHVYQVLRDAKEARGIRVDYGADPVTGRPVTAECSVAPIIGTEAKVIGAAITAAGSPEQKTNERFEASQRAAYRATAERLRMVADTVPVLIWLADSQGRCTFANRRSLEFFGSTLRVGETIPWRDMVAPEDRARLTEAWREGPGEGKLLELDVRLRNEQGEEVWHACRADPTKPNRKPFADCVGTFIDISRRRGMEEERVLMEAELGRARKLESLGLLAGGVAHDFNNVLGAILGHCELYLAQQRVEGAGAEHVEAIAAAAEHAVELTSQLLACTSKEAPAKRPLDLCESVRAVTRLLQGSLPDDVRVTVDCGPGPHDVLADPGQLDRILMNLVLNATEVTGTEGEVRIKLGSHRRGESPPAILHGEFDAGRDYISLSVSDAGPGIPPGELDRVFDPFYTTKPSGRGLGLATVLGIVRSHAGAIAVETEVGKGTSFRVYFPAVFGESLPQLRMLGDAVNCAGEGAAPPGVKSSLSIRRPAPDPTRRP